jgi:hypothetical protein
VLSGGSSLPLIAPIDIKPGSFPNSINLGSQGSVPVAILSKDGFDATTVDPLTVTLASSPIRLTAKGSAMASFIDINADGRVDLVVHVLTESLQLVTLTRLQYWRDELSLDQKFGGGTA